MPPVSRAAIHAALDRAVARPLTTVTAAHGYGKTTLLTGWARPRDIAVLELGDVDRDPVELAARLERTLRGDGLRTPPRREANADLVDAVVSAASAPPSIVVLDEADAVAGSASVDLLRRIVTRPGSRVRLVVAGRVGLGLVDGAVRARGAVLELHAPHLAFDAAQVAELLPEDLAPGTADHVVALSGGWPALVHRLVEVVTASGRSTADLDPGALLGPGGALTATLHDLLFVEEDRATLEVLAEVALLGETGAGELAGIRGTSSRAAADLLEDLSVRGLVRRSPGAHSYEPAGRVGLAPLVRRAIVDDLVARDDRRAGVVVEVVDGLQRLGEVHRALAALTEVGASGPVAHLIEEHGANLVDGGHARAVARAAEVVDASDRTPTLELRHGWALEALGELTGALERTAAGLERGGASTDEIRLDLHLLTGRVHLLRGELPAAIAALQDGDLPVPDGPRGVEPWALRAEAHLRRWELGEAARAAERALASADRDGSAGGLALAHRVLADLASAEGRHDDHERHHRRAFAAADRQEATSELVAVRVQRAHHHLAEGRTTEALFELDRALAATSMSRSDAARAAVLASRAEVLLRTGRVGDATRDAQAALAIYERLGSRAVRGPLHLLGDVHRDRGDLDAAREAYGRARSLAEPDGDARAALAATIGSARCADAATARLAADEALRLPGGAACAGAHLAAAWAAADDGDREGAHDHAQRAVQVARTQRDERGVTEAATLLAVLGDDPVAGLRRAARAWHRVHDPLWAARTELALARRSERADDRSRAGDLERRLAQLGSVVQGGELAHRQMVRSEAGGPVEITLLGGFQVIVDGRAATSQLASDPVARRLLQVVAVAAGRSVSREELERTLWPGEVPGDVRAQLDDAIARVRAVLRHDEGWTAPLAGDATALRLRVESIAVDLSIFERSSELGLRALREGRVREADAMLRTALAAHGGELLAGERDADWAASRQRSVREREAEARRALAACTARVEDELR